MKHLYLLALTLLMIGNATAQKMTDLTKDKILIGEVKDNGTTTVTKSKNLLAALNDQFSDSNFDKIEIKQGTTLGNNKESFYYFAASSTSTGTVVVRWLSYQNGKLYMENSLADEVSYKDFYMSCKGQCKPNLYSEGEEMNWICGDKVSDITQKNCEKIVSIISDSAF